MGFVEVFLQPDPEDDGPEDRGFVNFAQAIELPDFPSAARKGPQPHVWLNRQLRDVSDACKRVLETRSRVTGDLFMTTNGLAQIRRTATGNLRVERMDPHMLCHRLAREITFLRGHKDQAVDAYPTERVIQNLLIRPDWDLPWLAGVTGIPVLRPDGTIFSTPTYDCVTQIIFDPSPGLELPPIPSHPSAADAREAVGVLLDALVDFPFDSDASRANALALILTQVIRPLLGDGLVPITVIDGNTQGAGKGLLLSLASAICLGRYRPITPLPESDPEMSRQLTSMLLEGNVFIAFDNVRRMVDFPSLEAFVTTLWWQGRKLRTNSQPELANRTMVVLLGNGIRTSVDLQRRAYLIRLFSEHPRPWERDDFVHDQLLEWAENSRGRLLAAALTAVSAWCAAGRPLRTGIRFSSFETWADTIRGVLEFGGIEGFLANRDEFGAVEPEPGWARYLAALFHHYGVGRPFTIREHVQDLSKSDALREALPPGFRTLLAQDQRDVLNAKLGREFANAQDKRYGPSGLHVKKLALKATGSRTRWCVQRSASDHHS